MSDHLHQYVAIQEAAAERAAAAAQAAVEENLIHDFSKRSAKTILGAI